MCSIRNITSTTDLYVNINFNEFALKGFNVEYGFKKLNAAILRIKKSKSTALIHYKGCNVVIGTKIRDATRIATRKFAKIFQKSRNNVKLRKIIIQNISGTLDFMENIQIPPL